MKDRQRDRVPPYIPPSYQAFLRIRKVYRQTLTRLQERAAKHRPLNPLLEDGEPDAPLSDGASLPNPREAINKCARWLHEDLERPEIKAVADQISTLKTDLTSCGLRFTNTAGNFLARQYTPTFEQGKLWEDAWLIHHSRVTPGQRILDVGGASTIFSFYLASIGCRVAVLDNDWANCGTIFNARYVAKRMGWDLAAWDRDVEQPLPFPEERFDRVYSVCVLEHLPSEVRQFLMREIGRVLKPGGIVGLTMDYDEARPVLLTDKGLRFAQKAKLERDVIRPSGLTVYGPSSWVDACPNETFLGALFLERPLQSTRPESSDARRQASTRH